MIIYNNDGISISTIQEADKEKVLQYFQENSFNHNYLEDSLRPTDEQFIGIMDSIISGECDEENIFVIKKNDEVIGYESMFVEYDRLIIGHIAIKKQERGKGYGELLTKIAILVAENESRDVSLHCEHENKYLRKLGFKTIDNIHYLYKRKNIKIDNFPKFFVNIEEYRKRKQKEEEEDLKRYSDFLNSDFMKMLI